MILNDCKERAIDYLRKYPFIPMRCYLLGNDTLPHYEAVFSLENNDIKRRLFKIMPNSSIIESNHFSAKERIFLNKIDKWQLEDILIKTFGPDFKTKRYSDKPYTYTEIGIIVTQLNLFEPTEIKI